MTLPACKPSSALDSLASAIRVEHEACEQDVRSAVEHAIRAGELLAKAKAQVGHGEWLPWLEQNFPASARTAQGYMKLAEDGNAKRVAHLPLREALAELAEPRAHVSKNSGDNEWYTPAEYTQAARAVMGGIDLDPASSAAANGTVGASVFHAAEEDGLTREWAGRLWMNPPYARPLVDRFCERLAEHAADGRVVEACVLVNNATETSWFQTLTGVSSAIFFPARRVKFWHPEKVSAPLQGQAVLYVGPNVEAFRREFGERISGFSAVL